VPTIDPATLSPEAMLACVNPQAAKAKAAQAQAEPTAPAKPTEPPPAPPPRPAFHRLESHEELPLAAIGGDLEGLKNALRQQQRLCRGTSAGVRKAARFGSCELTPEQWCSGLGRELLELAESSRSAEELAVIAREKFDWYQFHGPKGRDEFRFTGYYAPIFEASRQRNEEFRFPLYAKPPELERIPNPHRPGGKLWRMRNEAGEYVPFLTDQQILLEEMERRGLVIAYVKDPTQTIDLKIEGAGALVIREPDGTVKGAYANYAASNGHPLRTPARVLRCMGYPPSVWGSQKKVYQFLRERPETLEYVKSWDPSHVFYAEHHEGPYGVESLLLVPYASIATDPTFLPNGLPALYTAERKAGPPLTRLALSMDIGGAIRQAHVDIFTGLGYEAFLEAETFTGAGRLYVPVPKGCGLPPPPPEPEPSPEPKPEPQPEPAAPEQEKPAPASV